MAVFCSTPFNLNEFEAIKKNNDTVGIVLIKDGNPNVIFWKKPLKDELKDNELTSGSELYQITRVDSGSGSVSGSSANIIPQHGLSDHNILNITTDDNYKQDQDNSKCAIHALNNLLKGTHFTTTPLTYSEGNIIGNGGLTTAQFTTILNNLKRDYYNNNNATPGVNLFAVCDLLKKSYPVVYNEESNSICGKGHGDSYLMEIINFALIMFGYVANEIGGDIYPQIFNNLNHNIGDEDFMGIILVTSTLQNGSGHFIAIRRNSTRDFVLIDSASAITNTAIISDIIPLNSRNDMEKFITDWLNKHSKFNYVGSAGYTVTKNAVAATNALNALKELLINTNSSSAGGRATVGRPRRRPRRRPSTKKRGHSNASKRRRKSSTRKRR